MPDKIVAKSRSFSYRNFVNRSFQKFGEAQIITPQYHLERAEKDEVVIVEDRKRDWKELAQKDVGKVGLANILELARRGQVKLSDLALKDNETGMDISGLNPMDPSSVKEAINSIPELEQKIKDLQKEIEAAKASSAASESEEK